VNSQAEKNGKRANIVVQNWCSWNNSIKNSLFICQLCL